jgi:hypothetical protein
VPLQGPLTSLPLTPPLLFPPPPLQVEPLRVVQAFCESKERLIVIGYNATLTSSPVGGTSGKKRAEAVKKRAQRRRVHPAVRHPIDPSIGL